MFYSFPGIRGINGFFTVFVFLQLISCAGPSKITEERIIIEMEKNACYGKCPVYTIKIDEQGKGLFVGVENTGNLGLFTFRLNNWELRELEAAFEKIGLFGLEDRYFDHITDLPTTYLTYRKDGKEKKIMDYYGAPKELKDLEKQIAAMVLPKKMKKVR